MCLAVVANMSPSFKDLHAYAAQRLLRWDFMHIWRNMVVYFPYLTFFKHDICCLYYIQYMLFAVIFFHCLFKILLENDMHTVLTILR